MQQAVLQALPDPGVAYDVIERAAIAAARWKTTSERALSLGERGLIIATCLPTLDKATRGGLRVGRAVVIGGAPGAGKTTLVVELALRWAMLGLHVAILAADEDADGILIRIGQLLGYVREDLESGDQATRESLAERLLEIPTLILVDADEDRATLEDVSAELKRRANGAPSILILDSLQTVPSSSARSAESPRARADAVVAACKRAARIDRHLVIATSELARASYRGGKEDAISDLAAFKESGGIEYGVALAIVLRTVPDFEGIIEATVPKNRLGGAKPTFRMRLDFRRASCSELDATPARDDDEDATKRLRILQGRILKLLRRERIPSATGAHRHIKGRKSWFLDAWTELVETGRIGLVDKAFRVTENADYANE